VILLVKSITEDPWMVAHGDKGIRTHRAIREMSRN